MRTALILLAALLLPLLPASGHASPCRAAIGLAEQSLRIPDQLLSAIGKVESGRPDPDGGGIQAWPWTINAEGVGHYYDSKAEAIAAVQALQARGVHSIDVGCLQVNLGFHPDAFASLDQAFDPQANALYAGRFLLQLFAQQGSWPHAAAAYHSQSPGLGADYQKHVLEVWAQPDRDSPAGARLAAAGRAPAAPAAPYGARSATFGGAVPRMASAAAGPVTGTGGQILRMAGAGGTMLGSNRGLDAYRSMPIPLAFRPLPRG